MNTQSPASVRDWRELLPPYEILPGRFIVLERGLIGSKGWWRIVAIDQTARGAVAMMSTGLTLWEDRVNDLSETGAKEIFSVIPNICEGTTKRSAVRAVAWDALMEVRRDVATEAGCTLVAQHDLLKRLSQDGPEAHNTALRILRRVPNKAPWQLLVAVRAATGPIDIN